MYKKDYVLLNKEGYFYSVYNDDAYIIANIMKYRLVHTFDDNVKTGFPVNLYFKVIERLEKYKISFRVSNIPSDNKDYGKYNNYFKYLKRDLPVDSVLINDKENKRYSGSFTIKFDDEEEYYEINDNISEDASIIKLVYKNNIGDIVEYNGEKFKIIDKNIEFK